MKRMICAAALIAALAAACSPSAKKEEGASSGPSLSLPGAGMAETIKPGLWRTVTLIESVENANLPPQAAAMMKAKPVTVEDCVTAADVAEYPKKASMPQRDGMTCSTNEFKQGFGKISGVAECADAQGQKTSMRMAGTYDAAHIAMKMDVAADSPMGPMTMKMSMQSERIGECAP